MGCRAGRPGRGGRGGRGDGDNNGEQGGRRYSPEEGGGSGKAAGGALPTGDPGCAGLVPGATCHVEVARGAPSPAEENHPAPPKATLRNPAPARGPPPPPAPPGRLDRRRLDGAGSDGRIHREEAAKAKMGPLVGGRARTASG